MLRVRSILKIIKRGETFTVYCFSNYSHSIGAVNTLSLDDRKAKPFTDDLNMSTDKVGETPDNKCPSTPPGGCGLNACRDLTK